MIAHAYYIAPGYTLLTVYAFNTRTRRRASVSTCRPIVGLNREERYDIIADHLRDFELPVPTYKSKGYP